jgi:ABC-type nitrate/sulfonate/bicarbonate transport system substrate-binding protein
MRVLKSLISFSICLTVLIVTSSAFAAAKLDQVTVGYSAFSGPYLPLWVSVEEQLGKKYGLDLKAIYAGRVRPQQLLASGEVPFVIATGTGAITSHILGVKDQVIILIFINKVSSVIYTRPNIKSAEELKGKTVATGRPGAFNETMVRYILRTKLGLVPDRDVKLLPVGEAALAFPALERNVVEAASLTMPFNLIAKKMGYRELIDYDKAGVVYPYSTVTTLKQTPGKMPDVTEKLLKTLTEGIYVVKSNKEKSMAILKKYMRGASDDVLQDTYEDTRASIEEVPTPSLDVIKEALEILSHQYPQAKNTDAGAIIDASFMRRIEQSGFIKGLSKK